MDINSISHEREKIALMCVYLVEDEQPLVEIAYSLNDFAFEVNAGHFQLPLAYGTTHRLLLYADLVLL